MKARRKMFKVGDRVWLKPHKITGIVVDAKYSEKGLPYEWYIDIGGYKNVRYDLYSSKNLTYSAQTMFEALGYEKKLEDSSYIIYEKFNFDIGVSTEIRIDKNKKTYTATNYTKNNKVFASSTGIQLHLAIHQQMVELGWLE